MIQTFLRDIDVFVDGLAPQARELLRPEVTRVIRETVSASPPAAPPSFRFNIGGKFTNQYRDPVGAEEVLILFDHRREVAHRLMIELKGPNSPEKSGAYKGNFLLFVNGIEAGLMDITAEREVWITNVSHYARRLEVGKRADGKPFVIDALPGMVERAASKGPSRSFRRVARIEFGYRDISAPWILRGRQIGTSYVSKDGRVRKRPNSADRRVGQPVRYPTIFIAERGYAGI